MTKEPFWETADKKGVEPQVLFIQEFLKSSAAEKCGVEYDFDILTAVADIDFATGEYSLEAWKPYLKAKMYCTTKECIKEVKDYLKARYKRIDEQTKTWEDLFQKR